MKTTKTKQPRTRKSTSEEAHDAVLLATEPVTLYEICAFMEKANGRSFSHENVRKALRELAASGHIFSRTETVPERLSRLGVKMAKGQYAMLYWHEPTVPLRTAKAALLGVSGVTSSDYVNYDKKKIVPYAMRKAVHGIVNDGHAVGPKKQTGNRIDRLEAEVRELRSIVASLAKAIN